LDFRDKPWSELEPELGGDPGEVSSLTPKGSIQVSFRMPGFGVAVDAVGSLVWEHNKRHGIRSTHIGAQSRPSILE